MRWPEPIACDPMYEPIIAPLRPIKVCDWDRHIARIASVAAAAFAALAVAAAFDFALAAASALACAAHCSRSVPSLICEAQRHMQQSKQAAHE